MPEDDTDDLLQFSMKGLSQSDIKQNSTTLRDSRRTFQGNSSEKYSPTLPEFVTNPVEVGQNPSQMDATSSNMSSIQRLGLGKTLSNVNDEESAFERILAMSEGSSTMLRLPSNVAKQMELQSEGSYMVRAD